MANTIIDELHQILNEDINFIDKNGIIISSTDSERLNTFHQAGFKAVKEKRNIIVYYDKEYKGARAGINLPILFGNEIVAAIGITGNYKIVGKYGKIIQKMTEILIRQKYDEETSRKNKDGIKYYLEGLIFGDSSKNFKFSDNIDSDKYLIVGDNNLSHISIEYSEKIHDILEKNLYTSSCIYSVFFQNIVILNYGTNLNDVIKKIQRASIDIENLTSYKFTFGISEKYTSISETKEMYNQAKLALQWGKLTNSKNNIFIYDNFDLELLLASIDKEILINYKNIFTKNIKKNYEMYQDLINSYVRNNGSISKISQELYIHKNTVQYRLNKTKELTGYNPRDLEDLIKLYLAFLIKI